MNTAVVTAPAPGSVENVLQVPERVPLTNGTELVIKSATVKAVPTMLRAVAKVIPALKKNGVILSVDQIKKREVPKLESEQWLELIADSMDALTELMAAGAGIPPEEAGTMDLEDFMSVTLAVIKVNYDFFINRLLPHLEKLMVAAAKEAAAAAEKSPKT